MYVELSGWLWYPPEVITNPFSVAHLDCHVIFHWATIESVGGKGELKEYKMTSEHNVGFWVDLEIIGLVLSFSSSIELTDESGTIIG